MSDKYFTVNIRAYLDKDDDAEDASLVGYFSLTVKPISVQASNISKTMCPVSVFWMKKHILTPQQLT